jgi:ribonuclease D
MRFSCLFSLLRSYSNELQGLCEWRDVVARAEDESTGYVLPNKVVLEIGIGKLEQNINQLN